MGLLRNYMAIRRIQTMVKAMTKDAGREPTKNTKPKRKTKLERTTEAQLFLEQDEVQKQLEAEDISTETPEPKPTEVHEHRIIRRLRKL